MRLDELERELLAERPEIDPDYATRLDDWAARGFPRGGELDPRRPRRRRSLLRRERGEGSQAPREKRSWLRDVIGSDLGPAIAGLTVLVLLVGGVTQLQTSGDHDDSAEFAAQSDDGGDSPDSGGREVAPVSGGADASEEAGSPQAEVQMDSGARGMRSSAGAELDRARDRRVAQTVSVSLATAPEDFRDAADGVARVVADHNGYITRSDVRGGDPSVEGARPGRASFELRIPAGQLQPALASLSELGHLVSRSDGTRDITARFDSARDRIETYSAARDDLLAELDEATTEAEREQIEARLEVVESRLAGARDDLASAQQRVRLVPVSVEIAADEAIGGGGSWGPGEAVDDAWGILRVALAVGLIAAAVLLPIALLALIAILASRALVRRGRERALDPPAR